jgi:hypothetical protein
LGPEGGRPGSPTQAVRHTCSGNVGIVKILCYIRSYMYTASARRAPLVNGALCLSTPKHNGKSGTDWLCLIVFNISIHVGHVEGKAFTTVYPSQFSSWCLRSIPVQSIEFLYNYCFASTTFFPFNILSCRILLVWGIFIFDNKLITTLWLYCILFYVLITAHTRTCLK